jgi:hypothetical protein
MNKIIAFACLLFFLVGCVPNNNSTMVTRQPDLLNNGTISEQSGSITPSIIEKTTEDVKKTKTRTPTIQKFVTPTTTLSQMEDMSVCLDNGRPAPPSKDFGINGNIVYRGPNGKGLYTVGGVPLVYSRFPVPQNQDYELWGFSPDGKTLAFLPIVQIKGLPHIINPIISLLNPNGRVENIAANMTPIKAEIPQGTYLYRWINKPGNWFTNNLINLNIEYAGETRTFTIHRVFDIVNNMWSEYLINNLPGQADYSEVGFSPDLTRALYTKYLQNDGSYQVVLWNLVNGKEIAHYPGAFPEWSGVRWSPDNSKATYISNLHEDISLFLVGRDSGERQEIQLPSLVKTGQITNPLSISWSPDSQFIAISSSLYPNNENVSSITYYIYDTKKHKLIYSCPSQGSGSDIYWSPDSKFIVPTDVINSTNELILYDIQTGGVIKIADNAIVGGWSDKFSK